MTDTNQGRIERHTRLLHARSDWRLTYDGRWVALNSRWMSAWEGWRAALNSWPQAARFSDYDSGRRHVWRCFCREANGGTCWLCVAIGTAVRVEGFLHEADDDVWWDFVSRRGVGGRSGLCVAICHDGSFHYMARRRVGDAREERPIGLCQVVLGLAKMPSFLPRLPTLPKCKTQMQNHWIPQFELFGKLVKCKPQLQNRWRCSECVWLEGCSGLGWVGPISRVIWFGEEVDGFAPWGNILYRSGSAPFLRNGEIVSNPHQTHIERWPRDSLKGPCLVLVIECQLRWSSCV